MNRKLITLALAFMGCCTLSSQAQNNCKSTPDGANLSDSSGCFPLTFHPADGGPVQTVWVPSTFIGPLPSSSGMTKAAGVKTRELDFGANALYTRPDYAQSVNVDVGLFVAYTGKYFGAEIDAADTVRSARDIHEPYLVAGPRIQYRKRFFTVYGKAQVGASHFSGAPIGAANNKQTLLIENYGAGLELRLSRHLKLRAVDANYQIYPTFTPHDLTPLRIGSGIAFTL